MRVFEVKEIGSWVDVKNACRNTINKEATSGSPSDEWRLKLVRSEHSPIRMISYSWKMEIPYWVSVHLSRHKIGVEHFVTTQRSDRTGEDRNSKSQDSIVIHQCVANIQALISMSRKRLCMQAAPETKLVWMKVIEEISKIDPIIQMVCVPNCIYQGQCMEFSDCGYTQTQLYKERLKQYRGE